MVLWIPPAISPGIETGVNLAAARPTLRCRTRPPQGKPFQETQPSLSIERRLEACGSLSPLGQSLESAVEGSAPPPPRENAPTIGNSSRSQYLSWLVRWIELIAASGKAAPNL